MCVLTLFVNQDVMSLNLNLPYLSHQAILLHQQNSRQKLKYHENEKSF